MTSPLRVLVAGCGNMGASHARAYHKMPGFEIAGLVSRGPASREALGKELGGLPEFSDYYAALAATKPDAVSINTYPETHGPSESGNPAGCHVFCAKALPKPSPKLRASSTQRGRTAASWSSATSCAFTRPGSGSLKLRARSGSPWSCA